jgi:hypothetical protein
MRAFLVLAVIGGLVFPVAAAPADTVVLKARLSAKYLRTTSKGSGTATITLTGAKVCWKFTYRGLDKPGDSGIRIAPPPAPGTRKTSVFPFTSNTSMARGCVASNRWGPSSATWAQKIAADPDRF